MGKRKIRTTKDQMSTNPKQMRSPYMKFSDVEAAERHANQMFVKHNLERKQMMNITHAQRAELRAMNERYAKLMAQSQERTLEVQRLIRKIKDRDQNIRDVSDINFDGAELERQMVAFETAVSDNEKEHEIGLLHEKLREAEDTIKAQSAEAASKERHYTHIVAQMERSTLDLFAKVQQTVLENNKRIALEFGTRHTSRGCVERIKTHSNQADCGKVEPLDCERCV